MLRTERLIRCRDEHLRRGHASATDRLSSAVRSERIRPARSDRRVDCVSVHAALQLGPIVVGRPGRRVLLMVADVAVPIPVSIPIRPIGSGAGCIAVDPTRRDGTIPMIADDELLTAAIGRSWEKPLR